MAGTPTYRTGTHLQVNTFMLLPQGHRAPVLDMAADSTGALVASAGADRSVRVWDVSGGYCTHAFTKHKGIILRVVIHPRELLVIAATQDAEVLVWDLVSKTMRFSLQGHFSAVTGVSHNRRNIVSC